MENKYPTNNSGKTGEEFLESIASSLRNLPNIKYLANEVSKLKKASKFATASTNTTYGTGGYVTPPPPTRLTNNRVSFFGSDMDWHSDIKAAILLSQFPDSTDIADASSKYYFAAIDFNAETSVDTIYRTSRSYLQYVKVPSTPAFSNELLSKLHVNNTTDLGIYSKSNSIRSQTYISRMHIGRGGDYSELYVGDYASILTNKNNAPSPTAALVLGNLAYTSSAAYKPYVASVIGNEFKLYHKDNNSTFGSSKKVAYDKSANQWYFNVDDEDYLGLTMDTASIVRKGTIRHIFQTDDYRPENGEPGMYQRYVNGNNMIFGKNGMSIVNATYTSGALKSLDSINNELTLTVSSSNVFLSQLGGFLFGSIKSPETISSIDIGNPKKYSLSSKIGFDGGGLWTSTNLAVNASIIGIRAYNDGTSDSIIDDSLPAGDKVFSSEPDYYRVRINTKTVYYRREVISDEQKLVLWTGTIPSGSDFLNLTKLPAPASAYGKIYYDGNAYFRCTQYYDYDPNTATTTSRRQYEWTPIDASEVGYGVRWGSSKWSSSRYNKKSLTTLRLNGPYDVAMDIPDDISGSKVVYSRKKFFEDMIYGGHNYIGLAASNAENITKQTDGNYLYTQRLSVYSWLPTSASDTTAKSFIDFKATYNALTKDNYYASGRNYSIVANANFSMGAGTTFTAQATTLNSLTVNSNASIKGETTISGRVTASNNLAVAGESSSRTLLTGWKETGETKDNNARVVITGNGNINIGKYANKLSKDYTVATNAGHIYIQAENTGIVSEPGPVLEIDGGYIRYGTGDSRPNPKGFRTENEDGLVQDTPGNHFPVRPIIICNDAHIPATGASSGAWVKVPNGTIIMSI